VSGRLSAAGEDVLRRAGGSARLTPSFRPRQVERRPPCQAGCPASGDIRGWVGTIAQRGKTGLSRDEAYTRAWRMIANANPFPSVLGRICPHPCEADCNRSVLDEPVAINAMERFLGDWALARRLPLDRLDEDAKAESVGVVGAGPSGLSFAFQMARRGYRVTVYEGRERAGGMLRYGVPDYRLPPAILDAEIERILDLGVDLRLQTTVGKDVTLAQLRDRHTAVYLGIGAQAGQELGIPGDDHPAVWAGTDYLFRVNCGDSVDPGRRVAVIGGGNTAVDAARTARRTGAEVVILYRRSRSEMPAIDSEVEEALGEGVRILFLASPVRLESSKAAFTLTARRMRLAEPDSSGRRRPVPVPSSEFDVRVDTVIAAVSQEPCWAGLEGLQERGWLSTGENGAAACDLWGGGDVVAPGIAVAAVAHGRRAAEALHARLRGLPPPAADGRDLLDPSDILVDFHVAAPRARPRRLSAEEALGQPQAEVGLGITEEQLLAEASRCFSCGSCFGCEQCWMYCTPLCFTPLEEAAPGAYFSLSLDRCEDCGKCVEVCPCGFLEVT
jgi:formate dehydrogenase major subunit